jgi:hypothetical protein
MMEQHLVMIAVLTGAVVAGAVWIGWSLLENLVHFIRRGKRPKSNDQISSGEGI